VADSSRFDHSLVASGVVIVSMTIDLRMEIWNARGLNDPARRTSMCSVVRTMGASIVCLQETKLDVVTPSLVMGALGADFDGYFCLPTVHTQRGDYYRMQALIAWVGRSVQLSNVHLGDHSLTAWVTPARSDPWWLTCVYGPQAEPDKIAFLAELREARQGPWVVCGTSTLSTKSRIKVMLT
jgi:hypothetical protein